MPTLPIPIPPAQITIVTLQQELSHLFGDRTVDRRTPAELSHDIRDRVLSEAFVQYVQN